MFRNFWTRVKAAFRHPVEAWPLEGLSLRIGTCPISGITPALIIETPKWRRSIRLTDGGDCYYCSLN